MFNIKEKQLVIVTGFLYRLVLNDQRTLGKAGLTNLVLNTVEVFPESERVLWTQDVKGTGVALLVEILLENVHSLCSHLVRV